MGVRGLSKKLDADKILADFAETLESFCEQMLSNGHREGDKWICGSLQNEEGNSCAIWLDSGGFNDTNPTADYVKGSVVDLWKAFFAEMHFREVLQGMELWMKDGTLPDGGQGRPTKNTTSKKRTLAERREELLQHIARLEEGVKEREEQLKRLIWKTHGWVDERFKDYEPYEIRNAWTTPELIRSFLDGHRKHLNRYQMQLTATDWLMLPPEERLSVYAQDVVERSEVLSKICQWRGISPDTFQWLAQHKHFGIGTHYWFENDPQILSSAEDNPSLGVWSQTTAVFPIYDAQGKLTSFHHRILPSATWQPKVPWFIEPVGNKITPMVIGDVPTADYVVIAESTWDAIAFLDLRKPWTWTKHTWAVIATRGAGNAQRIPAERIKERAVVMRLLQNDEGNEAWVASLPPIPQAIHRQIKPPEEDKDLNDWMRRVGNEEVLKAVTHK